MKEEKMEGVAPSQQNFYPNLKALRESHGKTLEEVSQATRIRTTYLEAIEGGQFQLLPERTYAESFIKTYAREIGIDSGVILSHYRTHVRDLAGVEHEKKVEKPPPGFRESLLIFFDGSDRLFRFCSGSRHTSKS